MFLLCVGFPAQTFRKFVVCYAKFSGSCTIGSFVKIVTVGFSV